MTANIDCTMSMTREDLVMFIYIFSGDPDKYVPGLMAIDNGKTDHLDMRTRGIDMGEDRQYTLRIYVTNPGIRKGSYIMQPKVVPMVLHDIDFTVGD